MDVTAPGPPHLIYLAIGFPPAAKSSAYRMRAVANAFATQGWDVTAVSLNDEAWLREMGLDPSLLQGLSPRVARVGVDLARYDLATDIREYSEAQALHWDEWLAEQERLDREVFPEDHFGRWLHPLRDALAQVHAAKPGDLVMVSPGPYVTLGAATLFCETTGVPLVLDYRDAWAVDVVTGDEAFPLDSRSGQWESRAVERGAGIWFVNDAIRGFYADRYPRASTRMRTVRNGFDGDPGAGVAQRVRSPLRFGYLGTVTLSAEQLALVLRAWRLARTASPLLLDATLEFRGHLGTHTVGANRRQRTIDRFGRWGVSYGGPVSRNQVAEVYAGWDALLLALIGGRYVTSGKVYEYAATGLPIVSAHEPDSAAGEVLADYPRWFANASLTEAGVAAAFIAAAADAGGDPVPARAAAEQFRRERITDAAVTELIEMV